MLEFDWPALLWLAPLPLLSYLLPRQKREQAALRVPFFDRLEQLPTTTNSSTGRAPLTLLALTLIWLSLLAGAAGPKWLGEPVSLPTSGRDLLLAVDISDSMNEVDVIFQGQRYSRLNTVKSVVGDFVLKRQGDRLGLILFGSRAYVQTPLTFDRETVKTLLYEAQTRFAGPYTAIGDAIGLAIKRLQSRPETDRVLILLTDGEDTASSLPPLKAAELAAKNHIRIHTVGFTGLAGSRLNTRELSKIAEITGGKSFYANNLGDLANIYQALNEIEPVAQDAETYRPSISLFHWPLALATLLSALIALAHLGGRPNARRKA